MRAMHACSSRADLRAESPFRAVGGSWHCVATAPLSATERGLQAQDAARQAKEPNDATTNTDKPKL